MPQDERGGPDDDPGAGPDDLDMIEQRFSMMTGTLVALGVVTLMIFAGVIWYAYKVGTQHAVSAGPAVVSAEQGDAKLKPEQPGGMNFAHQDKTVYDKIDGPGEDVEQLLPGSEEPMERPQIISPSTEDLPPPGQPRIVRIPGDGPVSAPAAPQLTAPEIPDPMAGARPEVTATPLTSEPGVSLAVEFNVMPGVTPAPPASARPPETVPEVAAVEVEDPPPGNAPEKLAAITPSEPAPAPDAASGAFLLQLGAFRTREAAMAGWKLLNGKHSAIIGELEHSVTEAELGEQGKFFRLQVGPFPDRTAASAKCTALKNTGATCLVVAR